MGNVSVRRELIGGPCDGVKVHVESTLMDLVVLCVITADSPTFQSTGSSGFPCRAHYSIRTTIAGHQYFLFQSITS